MLYEVITHTANRSTPARTAPNGQHVLNIHSHLSGQQPQAGAYRMMSLTYPENSKLRLGPIWNGEERMLMNEEFFLRYSLQQVGMMP